MARSVFVLGAGIVGISCALVLQRRGYRVTLLDRRGPGEETSSGNAGILSYSNITPLADPALLSRLHRLILNLDEDFMLHYPHFLSLLPWLLNFVARCRRRLFLNDGSAMSHLTLASIELHKKWISQAGLDGLLNPSGGLKLFRTQKTYLRQRLERELLESCGVRFTRLDQDEIYTIEPDLKRIFQHGVMIDESVSLRNPGKLCKAYADLFRAAGGEIRRASVRAIEPRGQAWSLLTEGGAESADTLVLCLGAWTPELLAPLGYANPLAIERGYHTVLAPAEGKHLSRPIFDVDAGYVMAPMEMGLRVTTGTNLTRRETAPTPAQVNRVLPRVREAFPVGEVLLERPWMGRRPTVPDTLPIIGAAPRHRNLWLAFAHSHMGLTLGPISGELIANFIDGEPQPFATGPCDPARYL